jgi:anti-sigma factor RsiW
VRCDFGDSLLQGYFDGELSGRRATEFERHLRHCARCATELVDLDLLRDSLQLAQLYEPATASLRRKINAPLHAIAPTTVASQHRLWHWLAAAAALLFVAILLGRVGHGLHSDDYQAELAAEIVDAHVRSLQPGPMTGIASNDERAVKGWLDGRAGFAVPVRDFANDGFALKGGRVDVIEGRAVAVTSATDVQSMYSSGAHGNRTVHRTQVPNRAFNGLTGEREKWNSAPSLTELHAHSRSSIRKDPFSHRSADDGSSSFVRPRPPTANP